MTAIGTSALTITVDRTAHKMVCSGTNYFRQSLSLSLAAHGGVAADLVLWVMRDGTILHGVGTGYTTRFSGGDPCTASLDTYVTTIETQMVGVLDGEIRAFHLMLWSAGSGELLAEGEMDLRGVDALYGDSGAVIPPEPTPTPGGWVHLGDDYWNGSTHYKVNATTGRLRKVWFEGAGDSFHEVYDDVANEIDIP